MNTSADYERMISQYDREGLLRPWKEIEENGQAPGWEPGKAFEYVILRAFQIEGAEVRWPYSVRIDGEELEQIDGTVYTDGFSCLTECKDEKGRVNVEPIAKLRNQLLRRPSGVIGVIFSHHGFTEPAVTLARFTAPQTILLWTGEELTFALEQDYMRRGLVAKYRACVEQAIPDYNIVTGGGI
jgi:hypothetical protein